MSGCFDFWSPFRGDLLQGGVFGRDFPSWGEEVYHFRELPKEIELDLTECGFGFDRDHEYDYGWIDLPQLYVKWIYGQNQW